MTDYNERSWISGLIIERPSFGLDHIIAGGIWKEVLPACIPFPDLDSSFGIGGMNAFCFYGPAGTGKHTTALAFAGSIPEDVYTGGQYKTFLAGGRDLETGDYQQTRKRVQTLFEAAAKTPSIIILDRLDNDYLWEAVVETCLLYRYAGNIVVFIIEDDASRIPSDCQRAMLLCKFDLPSYEERVSFFEDMENRMPRRNGRPTGSALAEHTKGMNYIQMKNLVKMVRLSVKASVVKRYGEDFDRIIHEYQNGNVYYTETEFVKYRDLLDSRKVGQSNPADAGRLRVFLENPPVAVGAPPMLSGSPQAGSGPAEPLLTDAMIEKDLFSELDSVLSGEDGTQ